MSIKVSIKNLSYQISNINIFNNFTYDFLPGINIIMGNNGTGKTTLLNIIAGNLKLKNNEIESGRIKYFDTSNSNKDISKTFMKNRLSNIGIVFQDNFLFDSLTFEDNLYIPLRFINTTKDKKHKLKSNIEDIVNSLLSKKKYMELKSKKVNQLSSGEKKKLSIIRAMVAIPKLLLVDEPTNHIDIEAKDWIIDFLKQQKESNVTVILISHDNNFVIQLQKFVGINDILKLPFNNKEEKRIDGYTISESERKSKKTSIINDTPITITCDNNFFYEGNEDSDPITGCPV